MGDSQTDNIHVVRITRYWKSSEIIKYVRELCTFGGQLVTTNVVTHYGAVQLYFHLQSIFRGDNFSFFPFQKFLQRNHRYKFHEFNYCQEACSQCNAEKASNFS